MTISRENDYKAYQLLRELDAQIAITLGQIAYGYMTDALWADTCKAHRLAFEQWIFFADQQGDDAGRHDLLKLPIQEKISVQVFTPMVRFQLIPSCSCRFLPLKRPWWIET